MQLHAPAVNQGALPRAEKVHPFKIPRAWFTVPPVTASPARRRAPLAMRSFKTHRGAGNESTDVFQAHHTQYIALFLDTSHE